LRVLRDTTFLIDAERSGDSLDEWLDDDDEAATAAITVSEIASRCAVENGGDPRRPACLPRGRDGGHPRRRVRRAVAEAHAELLVDVRREGRRRGAHDLMIAATAKATGRLVVTADRAAFVDLPGVQVRTHR
jgi:tRNA(fMet)-specific endonuclease VapC